MEATYDGITYYYHRRFGGSLCPKWQDILTRALNLKHWDSKFTIDKKALHNIWIETQVFRYRELLETIDQYLRLNVYSKKKSTKRIESQIVRMVKKEYKEEIKRYSWA